MSDVLSMSDARMSDVLNLAEIEWQQVELLPARTMMSLVSGHGGGRGGNGGVGGPAGPGGGGIGLNL